MTSPVQIRNVPEQTRRVLKARAAANGESLNSYLLRLLVREASTPTFGEVAARIASRGTPRLPIDSVEAVREAREEWDEKIDRIIEGRYE